MVGVLLDRRVAVQKELEAFQNYTWISRRCVRNNYNSNRSKLSPNGVINLLIVSLTVFGGLTVYFLSFQMALLVFIPLVLYTGVWMVYPMVEPSDGAHKAVEIMTQHPHLRQAQLEGCEVLFSLSRNSSLAVKETLVNDGAIDACLEAGLVFENDRDIISRVFAVLGHLAPLQEASTQLVSDGVVELSLIWLKLHMVHESACRHGLVFLSALCEVTGAGSRAKRVALDHGAIELVTQIMESHISIQRIQQWGCILLFNLALDVDQGSYLLYKQGGLDQVIKSLANHPSSANVNHLGVAVVTKCLTRDNPQFDQVVESISTPKMDHMLRTIEAAKDNFANSNEIQLGTTAILKAISKKAS
uniref:Uncharacterized protein n=1 Tax=Mucochytrium quahogii TaxID=96639 RepID=A0A7S2RQY2_9STRA|mmetsp:Transcript_17431/g.28136  ORF Transcript_17431/g.28136 Transcript_17431/m.28136 type:complete len:359 (-) Transcript_17431:41-1117(-)|eukprot:CAMPEP_0203746982 /NCGR_PEP_ID=MMETSP0098-20131031/2230_1 /ASSEMBLY_ACC=CAM_ASM_000208 /TAXON_ID=96639 /ORGANISM=" , Strain NY0313808BC1" /LENGTH=358 /DNA_ID=CAMNT_0050635243 /DNA_START=224 /DNA_END=1300 /DNA_ORIENTATION=+